MSVEISKEVIEKLTNTSVEIRLRAFEHIESRFMRALRHQLNIIFDATELCKQLIRWFMYTPYAKTKVVLELLARVLESSYGKVAIDKLGVGCLKTELKKIGKLLQKPQELQTIDRINETLLAYDKNLTDYETDSDLVNLNRKLSIASSDESNIELPNSVPGDFEIAWSKQLVADYNSLKAIADVLSNAEATLEEKENTLQYLQIVMADYPAEYMLQPPHLFAKLLQMCGKSKENEKKIQKRVLATLHSFSKVLRGCLFKRYKVDNYAARKTPCENTQNQINIATGTQLKISKVLELLMEKCLDQLETQAISTCQEIILVLEIVQDVFVIAKILQLYIGARFLLRAHQISKQLLHVCNQDKLNVTLKRIEHILITFMLLEMTEINCKFDHLADQYKLLTPQLIDFSMQINYPLLFDRIKKVVFAADITMETSYKHLQKLKSELEGAINILKQRDISPPQLIVQSAYILPILNILKSHKLTKILFDAILQTIPLYLTKNDVKLQATILLYNLSQLQQSKLKSYVYQRIAMAVKKHFASLMNNENIYINIKNQQLLSALIIGVPFDLSVIQQIIYDSFEEECPELKKNAENILILLLRTRHFYESALQTFIDTFSPILPLLQCCTHSKPIYDMLLKLFDPDSKPLPFKDLLRGNIGLMFANDSVIRSEALTRLIYMLNSLPQASEYVPNIIEVGDVLPNDLCMQPTSCDLSEIFIVHESCYDHKTFHNLLTLLDTPDVEPQIRKSTLLQLNTMCRSWEIIEEFCKEQAYCLVLSALDNSLRKDSWTDYIENVIPTINILVKILLYDSGFRHELAGISNVYVLLLRSLIHFSNDVKLRRDTSICLFLLVFGNFITFSRNADVEAPKIISNINVPFKCRFKSMSVSTEPTFSGNIPSVVRELFISKGEWKKYARQVIAHSYFNAAFFSKKDVELMRTSLDICPSLLVDQHDARFIRATNCFQNIRTLLKIISNATEQKTLIESVTTLRLQLMLHYQECSTLSQLPSELANGIYSLLSKHLQVTPGNTADSQVYESILDILHLCVRLSSIQVMRQLKNDLRSDFHHGVIIMLENSELSLIMYFRISEFLIILFDTVESEKTNAEQAFQLKLFEMVHKVIEQLYVTRNLQRIRCLLSLSKGLIDNLGLPDQVLHKFGRYFLKLSINLRSSTQTGSQFHRDCLFNFIKIFKQISEPVKAISDSLLKHVIWLCGHHDVDVRALAWICISLIAKSKQSYGTDTESNCISGTKLIVSQLSYLPGGLTDSCLCTFLDIHEALLVRHYAGNILILLLNETCDFGEAKLLIERQMFFEIAYNSLDTCIFNNFFPLHTNFLKMSHESEGGTNIKFSTCETVICYCRICIALIKLQPKFAMEICEKPLLFKLYELLKLPILRTNTSYYEMCSQICHLYALCAKDNFIFLQKTICHDDRWLSCLFDLLILPSNATELSFVYVLQLVLVLSREEFVFHRLCYRLEKNVDILRQLLNRALNIKHINSVFMRSTLSIFIYMLIKSQAEDTAEETKCYFISALEKQIQLPQEKSTTSYNLISETNKENILILKNTTQRKNFGTLNYCNSPEADGNIFISELILIDLHKVFVHFYPSNASKFDCSPGATQVLVCEALSLLLKISPHARLAANDSKLLNNILLILENFLREFGNNGITLIKRHREDKKLTIIKNLTILFKILLYWFSPSAGTLLNEPHCYEISKIIIKCWPWLEYSLELKSLLLQVCSFLGERSLPVCRQLSTPISSYPHSILQLIIKFVISETHKVKPINVKHLSTVAVGLRVMMNCCACVEGRSVLLKERALDVIDGLHPFKVKSPKIRLELLLNWLQFWELFSRYSEGGHARNLNSLCAVIRRFTPFSKIRLACLKILRNMCFVQQNRNTLLASSDFLNTTYEVITQTFGSHITDRGYFEEQLVIAVAIWQIISGGIKFVTILRDTKLAIKLRALRDNLLALNEEDTTKFKNFIFAADLTNVLQIIINIFSEV